MKKKIIIVVVAVALFGALYFANQKYVLRSISNVNVDAEEYGLYQDQMLHTECYEVHNLLFYKSGLYFTNASEESQIDDHSYWIVCSHSKLDYFSYTGKDTITHTIKWNRKKVDIQFYNSTQGHSTHINVVFKLEQEGYVQGFLRDVYQNDKDQSLEEINEEYLKPLDVTVGKILDQYFKKA